MRRAVFVVALLVSVATAVVGLLVVTPRVPLLARATELGRGPLAWRIDAVAPNSPPAIAGVAPGERLELRSPYADFRYHLPHDAVVFARAESGAPVVIRAGDAVQPNQTAWRLALRLLRFITHLSMCALAAILLWRRFDQRASRALAWFLVAFGFSLSFDAAWFVHAGGAFANVVLDLVIAAMLVAATRFAASIGDVEAPVRTTIARVSVGVGVAMAAAVLALLALQYLRGWNEPLLLTAWWVGWAVQLTLTLIALAIGFERAVGTERRRLAYVAITFALGFSGPIVATFGLALSGSAAGTPQYESLVAWRLTSLAIPAGFGYAVLFHHLLDIEFVFSRAMLYGVITSALVPIFAIARFTIDKVAGKNFAAGSIVSTLVTVLLLAYFDPLQKAARKLLDTTVFRTRTRELKSLAAAADDLEVLSDEGAVAARVMGAARNHAQATGAVLYVADASALVAIAKDLENAPHRIPLDDDDVARIRRTKDAAQPAGGGFGSAALALPMVVRGRLTGVVTIGAKVDGQRYAPDEVESLGKLATAAAGALEALAATSREREVHTLRAVRDEVLAALDPSRVRAASTTGDRSGPGEALDASPTSKGSV